MSETSTARLVRLVHENRAARYSGCRVEELRLEREIDAALVSLSEESDNGATHVHRG